VAEKTKADIYMTYLDQILAGENDIGPVEDEEIAKLLLLAKAMIAANLNVNIKKKEGLKNQLLAHLSQKNESGLSVLLRNDELDEENLNYVVAAGEAGERKDICPHCGSIKIMARKCPSCHH